MPSKKYVVSPGIILSKNDNDTHYISASQLIELYGVDPCECIIETERNRKELSRYLNLVWLYPIMGGNYTIKKTI